MKPIFRRGPSLQLRVLIAVVVAILLVVVANRFEPFNKIRGYLDTAVSPFHFLANGPRKLLDTISDFFSNKEQLQAENRALKQELLTKKADNLLLEQFRHENTRLRELLASPLRQDEHMKVAQVLSGASSPYRDQVVIDKGKRDGVYDGQPVINDKGVVGQVATVSEFNSQVILVCDSNHVLPVQVLRNDIRVLASGTGCTDNLQLEPLPNNIDIHVGDVVVTSGLGGRFPEGYPVGEVAIVKHDEQRGYTIIQIRPYAELQRLRYLLLLWGSSTEPTQPLPPSEVYRAANERLKISASSTPSATKSENQMSAQTQQNSTSMSSRPTPAESEMSVSSEDNRNLSPAPVVARE